MADRSGSSSGARSDQFLANIALLYYGEGLTQNEIANRVGVSRATIVNCLREGRERGIVDIHINGRALAASSLSRELRERFDLVDAYISYTDTKQKTAAAETLRQTARVAAMALYDIVSPGCRLGVAWGVTTKAVADQLPRTGIPSVTVHQMIGAMQTDRLPAAETCSIQVASRLGATCHTLHAPAVLSSADLAAKLREEPTIRTQMNRLQTLDAALFSVGDCSPNTHLVAAGIAKESELGEAIAKGGAGIVCARFIDEAGAHLPLKLDQRIFAIDLATLREVPVKLMVAAGPSKLNATLAALRGKLVSHLVVDVALAKLLLAAQGPTR
ncbi:MAG: sugar-binding domain-containing protein [Pseudomonadota bacterium]